MTKKLNNLKLYEQYKNTTDFESDREFYEFMKAEINKAEENYGFSIHGLNTNTARLVDIKRNVMTFVSAGGGYGYRKEMLVGCDNLTDMKIFDKCSWGNLEFLDVNLYIKDNHYLKSFDGFEDFTCMVEGSPAIKGSASLNIINNQSLDNLRGIKNANMQGGRLYIVNNKRLKSLEGIQEIKGLKSLFLKDNPYILDATVPVDLDVLEIESFTFHTEHLDDVFLDCTDEVMVEQLEYELDNCRRSQWDIEQILKRFKDTEHIKRVIKLLISSGYDLDEFKHLEIDHQIHMYDPKYKNTGAKSVAKVATGVTYGLF